MVRWVVGSILNGGPSYVVVFSITLSSFCYVFPNLNNVGWRLTFFKHTHTHTCVCVCVRKIWILNRYGADFYILSDRQADR